MREGNNVMVPLLDINESSGASEELLQRELVPWGALAQLTVWEASNLWRISWASILITLFSFMLSLVTQMFVGHLGELELAGASITNIGIQGLAYGIMVRNCTCFMHSPVLCICSNITSCCNTCCSHALCVQCRLAWRVQCKLFVARRMEPGGTWPWVLCARGHSCSSSQLLFRSPSSTGMLAHSCGSLGKRQMWLWRDSCMLVAYCHSCLLLPSSARCRGSCRPRTL